MKQILNFNFITVAILAVVLVLVAVSVGLDLSEITTGVEKAGSEVAGYVDDGEVDDVEGWGFIFGGAAVGLAGLLLGMAWIVGVLVPALLAVFMFVPALIARLIYRADKGRILAYRILMFFVYLWMGVLAFALGALILELEVTVATVVFLVSFLYTVLVVILGIRNTYTERIKCEDGDMNVLETEEV